MSVITHWASATSTASPLPHTSQQRNRQPRFYLLLLLLVLLALSIAACGGEEEENAANADHASMVDERIDPNSGNTGDKQQASDTAVDPQKRPIYISSLSNNLSRLQSYRMSIRFGWEGVTQSGAATTGQIEMVETIVTAQGKHTKFGIQRDAVNDGDIEVYHVGDRSYVYTTKEGTPQCVAAQFANVTAESVPNFSPIELVGKIEEATPGGKAEAINGLLSEHYRVTKFGQMLGTLEAVPEKNEVWVAKEGGYVMKYTGEATGDLSWLDKDLAQATIRWQYNLSEVDQLSTIDLPANCQTPSFSLDIPLPADATNKGVGDGVITFNSAHSVPDLANYYKDELPVMGWSLGVGDVTEQAANVVFTMESRILTLIVTPNGQGSAITIQESKQ